MAAAGSASFAPIISPELCCSGVKPPTQLPGRQMAQQVPNHTPPSSPPLHHTHPPSPTGSAPELPSSLPAPPSASDRLTTTKACGNRGRLRLEYWGECGCGVVCSTWYSFQFGLACWLLGGWRLVLFEEVIRPPDLSQSRTNAAAAVSWWSHTHTRWPFANVPSRVSQVNHPVNHQLTRFYRESSANHH